MVAVLFWKLFWKHRLLFWLVEGPPTFRHVHCREQNRGRDGRKTADGTGQPHTVQVGLGVSTEQLMDNDFQRKPKMCLGGISGSQTYLEGSTWVQTPRFVKPL